jgi:ABC-type glycerol-3-phosphate transport system substrate-binding protein
MTNSHVLAYRRDLYERYLKPKGIRQPGKTLADAWTWDDYLKAAKILTVKDPKAPDGKLWGSSMQAKAGAWIVYEWYSWLYGAGGRDIDYRPCSHSSRTLLV